MTTVDSSARGHAVPNARIFWPSPNPRMTDEELAAWLPEAIDAATDEAIARSEKRRADEIARIRRSITELEAMIDEVATRPVPDFVEVECPCCRGRYLLDDDEYGSTTIREHLERPSSEGCDRERWGETLDLREALREHDIPAEGEWLIVME